MGLISIARLLDSRSRSAGLRFAQPVASGGRGFESRRPDFVAAYIAGTCCVGVSLEPSGWARFFILRSRRLGPRSCGDLIRRRQDTQGDLCDCRCQSVRPKHSAPRGGSIMRTEATLGAANLSISCGVITSRLPIQFASPPLGNGHLHCFCFGAPSWLVSN